MVSFDPKLAVFTFFELLHMQGLHTKMVQVCSKCLSVPVDRIHLKDTSTDKVPNPTATGSSVSSDLNGMAVKVK